MRGAAYTQSHAHRTIDTKIIEIDMYEAIQCVLARAKWEKMDTASSVND